MGLELLAAVGERGDLAHHMLVHAPHVLKELVVVFPRDRRDLSPELLLETHEAPCNLLGDPGDVVLQLLLAHHAVHHRRHVRLELLAVGRVAVAEAADVAAQLLLHLL